jgi:hypothetical protein
MIRHSHTTRAQARFLVWLVVASLVLLPGASFQRRYNCQMTGARDLVACCCTGEQDCAAEISSRDSGGCCPSDEQEPADECGCCDISFERLGSELAQSPDLPSTERPLLELALLPAHEASPAQGLQLHGWARERVPRRGTGPPIYLLHRSLLI